MKSNYEEEINKTDVWKDYEKGVIFNRTKDLYVNTEKNYNFYHGKQWENAKLGGIQPMVYNIIKPIVKYKLGVIGQNHYEIVFNPNTYDTVEEGEKIQELCDVLNKHIERIWELQQVDKIVREATKDACINDEGIIHNYFDDEVVPELIDKNNIYYGNENSPEIQSQPYIIISYRLPVSEVRQQAEDLGVSAEKIELILPDGETREQAGYDNISDEVNPMCLVLLKYFKENGTVRYTRATKNCVLEENVDTNLTLYPIAHLNWEIAKGSARGIGAVNCIIPNQIEINKVEARRALVVKISAFPRLVYNTDLVQNPKALEKVGGAIEITGGASVEDVRNAIGYINPANMTSDVANLSESMKSNTRDLEGAGDVATGNVDPTQASGRAILAVQQASQQPLSEQVDNFKCFVEDMARIWFDMWKTYEVDGMNIMYEEKDAEGNIIEEPGIIPFAMLEKLEPNIKVDITPRSPYDRYAEEQSLENLFMNQKLTFEEFVDALPDTSAMPKNKLEQIIQKRKENQARINEMIMEGNRISSAVNTVMNQEMQNAEAEGGNENEMQGLPTGGDEGQGNQGQPDNTTMPEV